MRLLLADDDVLVTSGIQTIIEASTKERPDPCQIVAIAKDGQEALDAYRQCRPDIALLDIRMPGLNGIDIGRKILSEDPEARLLYLTTFLEDQYIIEAIQIGAKGYLLKTDFESLVPALEAIMKGQTVYGSAVTEKLPTYLSGKSLPSDFSNTPFVPSLTATERQLISCVAEGMNNKEIAEALHFSEGTVRNYLSVLLDKLQLRDRTQLSIYYYKHLT